MGGAGARTVMVRELAEDGPMLHDLRAGGISGTQDRDAPW